MESQKLVGIPALAESHCILASASANVFSSCSAWIQPRIGTKRTPKGINADNSDRTPIEGCMVYGAGCQIATWWCRNLNFYQPISFSKGHTSQVTVVKPLHSHDPSASFDDTKFNPSSIDYRFVSGDAKGGVKIWRNLPIGDHNRPSWKSFVELPGHQRSISCLASVQLPPNSLINSGSGDQIGYVIVTGASDGRLMIWKVVEKYDHTNDPTATAELLQTIECGNKIAMDATLTLLPGQSEDMILALALTDSQVALYSLSLPILSFKYVCSLPGHTDWVRCLDFISDPNNPGDVLLASGSQDGYIRLWRCSKACDPTPDIANDVNNQARDESTANKSAVEDPFKALDELTQTLKDEGKIVTASHSELEGSRQPTHLKVEMKRYRIGHPNGRSPWNMTSEAVLFGHEGWITNIHWALGPENHFQLISTSSDRSMIIWKPSADHNGIWLNSDRFGELTGSTNLGFFGAHHFWDQESGQETVLASGWTGGWHRWSRQGSVSPSSASALWEPQIAPTGHSQCVTGLEWDCEGEYILSCSHDQSTRLWGPWRRAQDVSGEVSRPSTHSTESWHELGRPQVHGHDLFGLTFIEDKRTQFVSISEEKVIRVFDTTERFVRLAKDLHVINVPYETSIRKRYENATVPPLGLSNRIEESETPKESSAGDIEDVSAHNQPVRCPPFEDELLSYTLWPEVEKVYGHPSELSAVASSASGKLMASACHATSAISASIRIHSTSSFRAIGNPLESHQLTVTELAFNHDDTFLISVSRDRGWSLWAPSRVDNANEEEKDEPSFELVQKFEKAHTRMIWDVSWGPKGSEVFVTGSRDKTVKVWSKKSTESESALTAWSLSSTIKFVDAVKSCRFLPYLLNNRLILGVGLEDGSIHLYSSYPDQLDTWNLISTIEDQYTHTGPVERLAFCPKASLDGQTKIRLASGGEDGMVRITDLTLVV
ncbi:WD40-repeat-containing domain protein [Melampsora americana]|nr:WD40-repeat-containing domain protein [Melampsora americana]